ncbi:MAG: UvrB/UvrC motif-containing protein [Clostridia bacterium]|nr:UvrB/UvrC motif-containing protein [Clostridia bacterium]
MECQKCKKRQANVHITQIINGKKIEKYLCEQCANEEKLNFELPKIPLYNLNNLLGVLFNQPVVSDKSTIDNVCPNCKVSYNKIAESGHMGCSECYKYFALQLDPTLRKIHSANLHLGKIPKRIGDSYRIDREMFDLKQGLRQAIEGEEYEKAAEIRDRIRALEGKMKKGTGEML